MPLSVFPKLQCNTQVTVGASIAMSQNSASCLHISRIPHTCTCTRMHATWSVDPLFPEAPLSSCKWIGRRMPGASRLGWTWCLTRLRRLGYLQTQHLSPFWQELCLYFLRSLVASSVRDGLASRRQTPTATTSARTSTSFNPVSRFHILTPGGHRSQPGGPRHSLCSGLGRLLRFRGRRPRLCQGQGVG